MNVVFWSCVPGMSAVSGSMIATALSVAVQHKVKCSVLQLQMHMNGLIPALIKPKDAADMSYFENVGIDALIRIARGGAPAEGEVENVSFTYAGRCLNVYASTNQRSEDVYLNDLLPQMPAIFGILNDTYKINFIDVPAGVNHYSKVALDQADVIVACLPQSKIVVQNFFENYQFDPEKLFIMLGDCDIANAINCKSVAHNFRKRIKHGRCLTVPHCTEFSNAMNNSRAISFFINNVNCKENDGCYHFMQKSADAARKLLEYESARR